MLLNGLHTLMGFDVNLQAARHTLWTEDKWMAHQQVLKEGERGAGQVGRPAKQLALKPSSRVPASAASCL